MKQPYKPYTTLRRSDTREVDTLTRCLTYFVPIPSRYLHDPIPVGATPRPINKAPTPVGRIVLPEGKASEPVGRTVLPCNVKPDQADLTLQQQNITFYPVCPMVYVRNVC